MKDISVQLLYNPQKSSVEILEKTLTQDRAIIADHFCSVMEELVKNGTTHHDLIIGPRGSGKTHVLAYICKKFLQNNAESQIKIISLSEEDRSISSSLDLLVSILRASNQVTEEEIQSQLNEVHPREALAIAETIFQNITKKQATIFVIENLDRLFSNLKQGGQRDFRGFLQSNPYIAVLSSSCGLFKDSGHHDHPFYGFFHIQTLDPLNLSRAQSYLIALARTNNNKELVEVLKEEKARKRVAAIYDLTGGNHRLLAMLSGFLTPKGFKELVEPFIKMVDRELTPYYQQRLDRLAPQQNKVLQAIVRLGDGAFSVKEIARHSLLSSQIVSRHLHDLLHGGYVRRERRGRYSFYELNEPLLRIVLDMKQVGHQPLPIIVKLLRYWYEAEELRQLEAIAPEYAKEYYQAALKIEPVALDEVQRIGGDGVSLGEFEQKEKALTSAEREYYELLEEGIAYFKKRDYQKAIKTFDEVVERFGDSEETELLELVAMALFNKGIALGQLERPKDAITVYDEVVERFGASEEPKLLVQVAGVLVNKGFVLRQLNRPENAIAVYDKAVEQFGASEEPELLVPVARALFNKGFTLGQLNRPEDAIAVYDEVVEQFGGSGVLELLEPVARALVNKGVTLRRFNRPEDAIAVYDIVVERFSDSEETELLEPVAKALVNKGIVLGQLERPEDEIAVYDEVVERFSDTEEPELLEQIAKALFNKGIVFGNLERPEDAIAVYDDVVERFGGSEETELQKQVAWALIHKGAILGELNRPEKAVAVYDEVVEQFGGNEETELLVQVASALVNKGVALRRMNRLEDAITVYDEVVERFGGSEESELLERVAKALVNKGVTLGEIDRLEDAITVYDEVVERFGASEEPKLLVQVAGVLVNKGFALRQLNRPEEAIAVYDKAVERFGASEEPELLVPVARALVNKGFTLGQLNRPEDEIAVYDEVVEQFGGSGELELLEPVARALVNKGFVLGQLERPEDAITVFDEVVERFGSSEEPELLEQVARALVNKGVTLRRFNRPEDAIAVYDIVVERFSDSEETELLVQVASVLVNKGIALGELERPEDAIAVYDEVVERFGESEIEAVSITVSKAINNKGSTLLKTGDFGGAIAAYIAAQKLWPDNVLAIDGCFSTLCKINKENEAFSYLDEVLDSSLSESASITLGTLLIDAFAQDNVRMRRVVEAYMSHDSVGSLIGGLVGWLRESLPKSESDARDLEKTEAALIEVFAEISEAKPALDMLTAARKDALGDPKALLDLPLELRRLIQHEKGEEPED